MERDVGIEPTRQVWKTRRLPLHQSRLRVVSPGWDYTPSIDPFGLW
jgi:hypothetical protein